MQRWTGAVRSLVDDASFKIGYLDYDAGRLDAGLARFAEHLERIPSSRHADEAHWFMGWSLFKQALAGDSDINYTTRGRLSPRAGATGELASRACGATRRRRPRDSKRSSPRTRTRPTRGGRPDASAAPGPPPPSPLR